MPEKTASPITNRGKLYVACNLLSFWSLVLTIALAVIHGAASSLPGGMGSTWGSEYLIAQERIWGIGLGIAFAFWFLGRLARPPDNAFPT